MGIPYYFMSLIKSHSGIIRTIRDPLKVDILCIDFNCLIHKYLKDKDPIESLRASIFDAKIASEAEVAKIDASIKAEVSEVVEFAKNSPEPDESELLTDIYK